MTGIATLTRLSDVVITLQVYKRLYQAMLTHHGALERPSYWRDLVDRPEVGKYRDRISSPPQSKL